MDSSTTTERPALWC